MSASFQTPPRIDLHLIRGAALASLLALSSAFAAQIVTPIHVSGGNRAAGDDLSTGSINVPAGTTITFDVRYQVTSPQTVNEAGLGLKLRYDANRFENINVTAVNASAGNFTDVTSMNTKCAVAAPSDQAGTYSISGFTTPREVVFGWLDTSVRAGGAVGWLGTADPASPNGCLNPGFTTATGAFTPPTNLFRVTMKTKPGFTSGSTTIRLTADGNVSFANASPGMADKDIAVNGAAAPSLALAGVNPYVSRKTHGAAGTFDLPISTAGSMTPGTFVTVEPRQAVSGSHTIVVNFTGPVSAAEFPTVTATGGLPVTTSFSGNSMIVTVGNSGTPVPNATRVRIQATGQGAAAGVNPDIVVGFLLADVNSDRNVSGTDINAVKAAASAGVVNSSTFLRDINLDGNITGTDVNVTKARAAASMPVF